MTEDQTKEWLDVISDPRTTYSIEKLPTRDELEARIEQLTEVLGVLLEAAKLADFALAGANMNMSVVKRKLTAAIKDAEDRQKNRQELGSTGAKMAKGGGAMP